VADKPEQKPQEKKEIPFWDTSWAFVFLVAVILLARFYIIEPFKIPSGSMEPTLIGHEDYGDRIVTNKLAYVTARDAAIAYGGVALAIIGGFIASKSWRRWRSIAWMAVSAVAALGGMGFLWINGAIAGEPQRFDVAVFKYETKWNEPEKENKQINYIKRLCGLPGETIIISGGNLFKVNPQTGKPEIIRVWQTSRSLQESLWYPVAKTWRQPPFTALTKDDLERTGLSEADLQRSRETLDRAAFPWNGVQPGTPGATLEPKALVLDGNAPVELTYKYPVMNVHLKHGRWPFRHVNCPAMRIPGVKGAGGVEFSDPRQKSEDVSAYVSNTWEGVQCPNCKQLMFPVRESPDEAPELQKRQDKKDSANQEHPTNFFYYSNDVIGDLKLNIEVEVQAGGTIEMEVGSNFHRAKWTIPSNESASDTEAVHPVQKSTSALSPGTHTLTLAYVDATVVAELDGNEIERRTIEVSPLGDKAPKMKSIVRVAFGGTQGKVTKLDLYRNLVHILPQGRGNPGRRPELRGTIKDGMDVFEIPQDFYLMLGDNGPSSADSRVWGYVPKENLVGRASFIWWPPSRWRIIK
jgi:signal peptidase I